MDIELIVCGLSVGLLLRFWHAFWSLDFGAVPMCCARDMKDFFLDTPRPRSKHPQKTPNRAQPAPPQPERHPRQGGWAVSEQDREPRGGVVFWQGPKVIFNGDYVGTHEHFAPKDWNSSRLCSRCSHLKVGPLPPNAPFSKPRIEVLPVVGLSPFDGEGPASNVARAGQGAGSGEHSEAD